MADSQRRRQVLLSDFYVFVGACPRFSLLNQIRRLARLTHVQRVGVPALGMRGSDTIWAMRGSPKPFFWVPDLGVIRDTESPGMRRGWTN